jgi:hypothetical protein
VPPRPILTGFSAETQQEIPNLAEDIMGLIALADLDPEIRQQINSRLEKIDEAHWEILEIIAVNDAALKTHIKKLEARIRLHDESL